jgi:hypothetical protein
VRQRLEASSRRIEGTHSAPQASELSVSAGEASSTGQALIPSASKNCLICPQISDQDGGSSWFSTRHDPINGPSGCILRFLYYPALPEGSDYKPEVDIRAGAHSDYGSITLLFQRPGQPGLEILTPSNEWSPVPVHPPGTDPKSLPPILVNIGDLLSHWTNGLLKSTVHRVIFPKDSRRGGEDRYSIAYFCHPVNDAKLIPVPSPMVTSAGTSNGSGAGKVLTAEEHLNSRLAATYGWQEEEQKG